jgi:hypothetical protein
MKLTVLCLFAALTAGAQSTTEHLPVTDSEKIADALRAAPNFITDGATIVDYPASKGGEFRILRKGTSEWTCLPGPPPGSKHDDPGCFDSVFFQWLKDDLAGRPQHIDRLGISYMYMGQWVPGAFGGEFHVGPHTMVVTPHPEDLQGFTRGGWNGTYIIHLPGPDQADKWFLAIQFIKLISSEGCDALVVQPERNTTRVQTNEGHVRTSSNENCLGRNGVRTAVVHFTAPRKST